MKYHNILLEKEAPLAVVTINRPDKLNALNKATIEELNQALISLEEDREVRAIILTGSGDKAFVAGADIAEFSSFSVKKGKALAATGQHNLFNLIENLSTPIIAAVNGYALGGGLELAMACHFRIASHNARLGLPEVSLGLIPGYGGTQRLPQLIGKGRAFEMIMTGMMIEAETAHDYGLVNEVTTLADLIPHTRKLAQKIANNSPVAISYAIKAVNAGFKYDEDGFQVEIKAFGKCFGTNDFKEGTTAFLEKRKAKFSGS